MSHTISKHPGETLVLPQLPIEILRLICCHVFEIPGALGNFRLACTVLRDIADQIIPWQLTIAPTRVSAERIKHLSSGATPIRRYIKKATILPITAAPLTHPDAYYEEKDRIQQAVCEWASVPRCEADPEEDARRYQILQDVVRDQRLIIEHIWTDMLTCLLRSVQIEDLTLTIEPDFSDLDKWSQRVYTAILLDPIPATVLLGNILDHPWKNVTIKNLRPKDNQTELQLPQKCIGVETFSIVCGISFNCCEVLSLFEVHYFHDALDLGRWTALEDDWPTETLETIRGCFRQGKINIARCMTSPVLLTFLESQTQLKSFSIDFEPGAFTQVPSNVTCHLLQALPLSITTLCMSGCHLAVQDLEMLLDRAPRLKSLELDVWLGCEGDLDLALDHEQELEKGLWYTTAESYILSIHALRDWKHLKLSTSDPSKTLQVQWALTDGQMQKIVTYDFSPMIKAQISRHCDQSNYDSEVVTRWIVVFDQFCYYLCAKLDHEAETSNLHGELTSRTENSQGRLLYVCGDEESVSTTYELWNSIIHDSAFQMNVEEALLEEQAHAVQHHDLEQLD